MSTQRAVTDRAREARALLRRIESDLGVSRQAHPGQDALDDGTDSWPGHEPLAPAPLLTLKRGTVTVVQGSTGLALTLIAGPSQAGAWIAVVGHPDLGVLAAVDAGINITRLALVPDPGPTAAGVLGALLDGIDLVVIGPRVDLTAGDRRKLTARARERDTIVIVCDGWPGAHAVLTGHSGEWNGTDHGTGWLTRRTLTVERDGRSTGPPVSARLELPLGVEPLTSLAGTASALGDQSTSVPAAPSRLRCVG